MVYSCARENGLRGYMTDLSHTMAVSEDDTDLGGGQTLLGKLENLVLDLVRGELEPLGDRPPVGESGLGDTLARCVHTTHRDA